MSGVVLGFWLGRWASKGKFPVWSYTLKRAILRIRDSIYAEIGPGNRIALSKLAVEFFERTGRPLRLAIDISIWLFQIQAGEGGTNPALRTFYYRILRLIALSIHPLFVFDGPNKPPLKRNKRTLGPGVKTASIPEFLAKQLLKHFGLPMHQAPGEAEAECALLQRSDIVDAVLSEDADTIMFGCGMTIRNLSAEGTFKTKTATHVNIYDAEKVTSEAGLDRPGMILVALMSGGDYIPEGIPGCGPRTACQAARAGFGSQLCQIESGDAAALKEWKDRLQDELKTNKSKFFSRKHKTLELPSDFPRLDVLKYYTHPCVSSAQRINEEVRGKLAWDREIDFQALRTFTGDAFEWLNLSGAKKFIRNLAPALLAQELRLRGSGSRSISDDSHETAIEEARLVRSIHMKRNHVSTDQTTELRISFVPLELVPLDLSLETPDPETTDDIFSDKENEGDEEPSSPKKKRQPSKFDPAEVEKVWLLETFVKVGVPLKYQDWEESFRDARKYEAMKASNRKQGKAKKPLRQPIDGGMPKGALKQFTQVTKPSAMEATERTYKRLPTDLSTVAPSNLDLNKERDVQAYEAIVVEIVSSPEQPSRKKAFDPARCARLPRVPGNEIIAGMDRETSAPLLSTFHQPTEAHEMHTTRSFQNPKSPPKCPNTPKRSHKHPTADIVDLCSPPKTPSYRQRSITEWASPQKLSIREVTQQGQPQQTTRKDHEQRDVNPSHLQTSVHVHSNEGTETKKTCEIIRVRESLNGTWCIEDGVDTNGSSSDIPSQLGSKRKRINFRRSQVAVVDLTQA